MRPVTKLQEAVLELLENRHIDYLHPDDRRMLRAALKAEKENKKCGLR